MARESSKDIAEQLALRADQPPDVTPAEYRRLFIKGLGALLREVDSISYAIKNELRKRDL